MAHALCVQENRHFILNQMAWHLKQMSLALMLLCSCSTKEQLTLTDPHSASNPAEAKAEHLVWRAQVDFENRSIKAKASWFISKNAGAKHIVFDTYDLIVERVWLDENESTNWHLGDSIAFLGRSLRVELQEGTQWVHVIYKSNPQAKGLQWLEAEQTKGQKNPFLFSQGQAILTRSWLPCQDSPGLRFSFEAEVQVPPGLMAVMSALNPTSMNPSGLYQFKNSKPIPAYLFALAVGDFSYRAYDDRSGIYAEAQTLDAAWQEFANLPSMMRAAEKLFGPYPWERFDVLVLPPVFPFGGMENPMIMFATPSIIAGDRSLTNLVAHELSHSWSGNLVTHASWNDFWINEGFTTYIERRILEEIEGPTYAEMITTLGNIELESTVKRLSADTALTRLKMELSGLNPDLALSSIPFQKGVALLLHIESEVGRSRMDAYVKNTFAEHAFTSMTSEMFLAYLNKNLLSEEQMEQLQIRDWIFKSGLPSSYKRRHSVRFANVDAALQLWLLGEPAANLPTAAWSVYEWIYFLKQLPYDSINPVQVAELDEIFNFSASNNAELSMHWQLAVIRTGFERAMPQVESFLAKTGRRKLLVPVYQELYEQKSTRHLALTWFSVYRKNYHPIAVQSIEAVLR